MKTQTRLAIFIFLLLTLAPLSLWLLRAEETPALNAPGLGPVGQGEPKTPAEPISDAPGISGPPAEVDLGRLPKTYNVGMSRYERYLAGLTRLRGARYLSDEELEALRAAAMLLPPDEQIHLLEEGAGRAPLILSSFASLDYSESLGSTPPDPEISAGPNHIIAVVNVAFEVYDKNGVSLSGPVSFSQFFAPLGGTNCTAGGPFDPNTLYAENTDRFIVATDGDGNAYCVGVSKTNDPTGEWWLYEFPTNVNGYFFDYPHAGIGRDALYMGANMFEGNGFAESRVWAYDLEAMYQGLPAAYATHSTGDDFTPQPLHLHGYNYGRWPTTGPHYFLADRNFNGANYQLYTWADPFGANIFTSVTTFDFEAVHGVNVGMPVNVPQSGGSSIQANDFRPQDFDYQDGYGWTAMTVSCNPGTGTVNCVQWGQVNLDTATLVQAGVFASNGQHRFFPDIAANQCGDAALGYTKSSGAMFPGIFVTGRLAGDPPNTMQAEAQLKAGEVAYTAFDSVPYRWGDYTEMTIDPDGITFWYLGEYSKNLSNSTRWGTYIGSLQLCDPLPDFRVTLPTPHVEACVGDPAIFTALVGQISGYSEPVTLAASGLPPEALAVFTPAIVTPPGSSTLEITTSGLSAGSYAFEVQGTALGETRSAAAQLTLAAPLSSAPALLTPAPGAPSALLRPTFTWSSVPGASSYLLEISQTPDFAVVLHSATTPGTSFTLASDLAAGSLYFWRVTAQNACGNQAAAPALFITVQSYCASPALPITDLATVSAQQTLNTPGSITDLNVYVGLSHTYVGDLVVEISLPAAGIAANVIDRPGVPASSFGCGGNNIQAWLDDEASTPVENVCVVADPTIAGTFTPNQPLSVFDGTALPGTWQIRITDSASGDTGTLNSWCLQPQLSAGEMSAAPASLSVQLAAEGQLTRPITLTNTSASAALPWQLAESADACITMSDLAWLSAASTGDTLLPGAAAAVPVTFNAAGLASGQYTGHLCVFSADPTQPLTAIPVNLTVGIGYGQIAGSLQVQGRAPANGGYAAAVVSAWAGGAVITSTNPNAAGAYSLTVPAGTYTITVELPLALDAARSGVSVSAWQTVNLPTVTLLLGDTDDSDTINILDLSLITAQYGSAPGAPGYDSRADLNLDGSVDIRDIALAAGNYGKSSGTSVPWPP